MKCYKVRVVTDVEVHFDDDDATIEDALHVAESCTTSACGVADSGIGPRGAWKTELGARVAVKWREGS